MVVLSGDHLGRSVAGAAASCLQSLALPVGIGETEVDDFDVVVVVHEQVLGLQITMANAQFVQVLDARDKLEQELGGLLLSNPLAIDDVLKQLAASRILHDQIELFLSFNYFIELHDHGMPNNLQNFDFSCNSINVVNIYDFIFF